MARSDRGGLSGPDPARGGVRAGVNLIGPARCSEPGWNDAGRASPAATTGQALTSPGPHLGASADWNNPFTPIWLNEGRRRTCISPLCPIAFPLAGVEPATSLNWRRGVREFPTTESGKGWPHFPLPLGGPGITRSGPVFPGCPLVELKLPGLMTVRLAVVSFVLDYGFESPKAVRLVMGVQIPRRPVAGWGATAGCRRCRFSYSGD